MDDPSGIAFTRRQALAGLLGAAGLALLRTSVLARASSLANDPSHQELPMGNHELGPVEVYSVIELTFRGPAYGPTDTPARDVWLWVRFEHEGGALSHTVHGFWDADGAGGREGDVFKVRFCPSAPGRWTLAEVSSSVPQLAGQREGCHVSAVASNLPGFWTVDEQSPGRRWFKRSDGSHPYVFGNTHYSFLSGMTDAGPSGADIAQTLRDNARYFKKLRMGLQADRYPHPTERPFLDDAGQPTAGGDYSHRPDPSWFHNRVDLAVATAFEVDLIADLILAGPDVQASRSTLRAAANNGDPTPYLRYIAARYGSYPNVWLCLCNEWDIRKPAYTPAQVVATGQAMKRFLAYPTPLSVHGNNRWCGDFNTQPGWATHAIVQGKIKTLAESAAYIEENYALGKGMPVVNDELAYEGAGDGFSRDDLIEAHLGAFLGGGYASTGHKPADKKGHYFWGAFKASEHAAAANLGWLRQQIDADVAFWHMAPAEDAALFTGAPEGSRVLAWPGRQYVLGTDMAGQGVGANLPSGPWRVAGYDAIAMTQRVLAAAAGGRFVFDVPASRAAMTVFTRQ